MRTTDVNGPNTLAQFSVFSIPPLDARDTSKCRSASAGSCSVASLSKLYFLASGVGHVPKHVMRQEWTSSHFLLWLHQRLELLERSNRRLNWHVRLTKRTLTNHFTYELR